MQLIQADNDAHLWAQSFDRQLIDIFSVEAEVAKSIADSLQAKLSPQEKSRVETKATNNSDAYVLYLRGREYQARPDNLLRDFESAAQLYEQAIRLDPNFALAHDVGPARSGRGGIRLEMRNGNRSGRATGNNTSA